MKSFNWLHLTDLHFGLDGQSSLWPNVRQAFWDDLEKLHAKSGPWDAVLFTGDLVQSGKENEYAALEDKVLGPLWDHFAKLGSKDPVLLTVPGNHDLVRPVPEKPTAALRLMLQKGAFDSFKDEFWDVPDCEYRKIVTEAFANYQKWVEKNSRGKGVTLTPGILPGDFVATINVRAGERESLKIGVAGINTTFLQIAKGDYTGRLVLDARQLHQACGGDLPAWTNAHDACILMTHQGPAWLDLSSRTEAYGEINPAGQFAVHLFGHMHENVICSTAFGGGETTRQWQGNSLFGLEWFGEPPHSLRKHGYGAGRIEFDEGVASIRHWPRRAHRDTANGWRFSPDHESCIIDEQTSCTNPERLKRKSSNGGTVEGLGGETPRVTTPQNAAGDEHRRHLEEMELQLNQALEAFKGQPTVFVEPKLSKKREFNDDPNELHALIESPCETLIIAPPEFGLTCLGLYMRLEAFKKKSFWMYIDAEHTKARRITDLIDQELLRYNQVQGDLKCIVLDSWNPGNVDHMGMIKNIISKCPNIPLIVLAEDSLSLDPSGNLSKFVRDFKVLHLQALTKNSMRQLVVGYNAAKSIGSEDVLLSGIAGHLESINIHRTPLNCYTLLRVLDRNHGEKLLNKSKLLKAVLFVLFTDFEDFSYLSHKPEVEECSFVLGCFCKNLVEQASRSFEAANFISRLKEICAENSLMIDVSAMVEILLENNILVKRGNEFEFRHRYWIFYFAAEWMCHDDEFRKYILNERNYVNYPEIIEFYTGIDGKRADAVEMLLSHLTLLIDQVDKKIGIESSFDPVSSLLWDPSEEFILKARTQIAEKVESSNLPADIKDKHADRNYESAAPYDQSIRNFLNDYSVLCLFHSIKAASRALRNSSFVDVSLRNKLTSAIFNGWEEIARVVFWICPILAKDGRAIHDGFAIELADGFSENIDERFKEIIVSTPHNVVKKLGGDLASNKIGPLVSGSFQATGSKLQKHMMAVFIATVRPMGWYESTLNYINLLHPRSFYLGNMFTKLNGEIEYGDFEKGEEAQLKQLTRAIIAKRQYAPKESGAKAIPPGKVLSQDNKLPIDKLLKGNQSSHLCP